MKILVTGGAGYIGSFMVQRLLEEAYEVVVVDSLERGKEKDIHKQVDVRIGDLGDDSFRNSLFREEKIDAIIHFAGYIAVGESMEQPYRYFQNNVSSTIDLLEAAYKHAVTKIIFSSSAAVYGNPITIPIPEDHPKDPTSVYGESKLMIERVLRWYQVTHGVNSVALRYFNACGAALDGSMGEEHTPETHIIPNAMRALLEDRSFTLFGDDYKTPDGTCRRDYIHILDLVESHLLALKKLENDKGAFIYNVGTGKGYSNREVIATIEKISGKKLQVQVASRRPGDADELVADPTKVKKELGFVPKYSDLDTIVQSAWKWHSKQ